MLQCLSFVEVDWNNLSLSAYQRRVCRKSEEITRIYQYILCLITLNPTFGPTLQCRWVLDLVEGRS